MRLPQFTAYFLLVILLASCTSSKEAMQQASSIPTHSQEKVIELIEDLPASNDTENQWIFSELEALGPYGIQVAADKLVAPGNGDDTQARYAINGLTKYVSRSGAASQQAMFEKTLLDELKADHPKAVKDFLMTQLELLGSDQSVPVLQSFLGDEMLHESAVHALRAINTQQARQALVQALSTTQGTKQAAVIKALGDMQATSAAQELLDYVSAGDWQTQKATLYALAQTGDPVAIEPLAAAVDENSSYKKTLAQSYYVLLADRMAEEGAHQQSIKLSRNILSGDYASHIKSSALAILFKNEGEAALDDLLAAAAGSDEHLRFTALSIFKEHSDLELPQSWVDQFNDRSPAVQADIIAMLGADRASVSMLMPIVQSDYPSVRAAAMQAIASIGGDEALAGLIDALLQTQDPEKISTLKRAILQLPTESLVSEAADALPSTSTAAKVALIEMLAERHANGRLDAVLNQLEGADSETQMAVFHSLDGIASPDDLPRLVELLSEAQNKDEREAIQGAIVSVSMDIPESKNRAQAVLNALNESGDNQKPYLLEALTGIGGEKALRAVVEATNSSNETVQHAAISALAQWPDASAIKPLQEALKDAPASERDTIVQGYIRLVAQSKYSSENKIQFLNDALTEASSPERMAVIIDGFSMIDSPEALQAVARHFDDNSEMIRETALRSAAKILMHSDTGSGQALSLVEATTSSETKNKIEQYIQELKSANQESNAYTSLFNGTDLSGWTGAKDSYKVEDGQIISKDGASGNLFTEQEYSDFILKFEFKLTPGANNGLGIRAPLEGNPAYDAMELQIIDNNAEKYADLEPFQYHGSVYGVVPAERGHLNPIGEWNTQEVIAEGSRITVKVNGETIVNTDIEEASSPETMDGKEHPGLLRKSGHIGFLGHGDEIAVRNIRIRDLNVYLPDYSLNSGNGGGMNQPPEGFNALFNGENLQGWKGLVGNPESRAKMSEQNLVQKQKDANADMRKHWSVQDGVLSFDGSGHSLVTEKKYKDFEMMVDWKIEPGGDSGIYLRGTPQVQIWDVTENPQGSGGLYNNKNHPSEPVMAADNAIGEWNSMRVKMVGEEVTVHLNDQLVVPDVVMENYWNRGKPIYSEGQIELQSHNTPLYFKNIFIREIPRLVDLFNGQDLTGWERIGGDAGGWHADGGLLYTEGGGEEWEKGTGGGWLSTKEMYENFKLELEYRLPEGGNSGVFLRAPHNGDPAFEGLEIQLLDDDAEQYAGLDPWQYTGSIYDVKAPSQQANMKAGQWQKMEIIADGPRIKVLLNGDIIINTSLVHYMDRVGQHPGLKRRSGYIGLQNHNSRVEFRNIKLTEIE